MKISGFVMILLVVGLCFSIVGSMVNDMEDNYPDIDVNSTWETKYDYSSDINKSVYSIKEDFDTLKDEDVGWFPKIEAGITVIPKAITLVPEVLFKAFSNGVSILSDVLIELGVPNFVIVTAIVAFIVIISFALISFWHRERA